MTFVKEATKRPRATFKDLEKSTAQMGEVAHSIDTPQNFL